LSRAKVAYLFLDELIGWALKVAPFVRNGGWVVVERGWWDLAVDPRRYRLGAGDGLAAQLGRLLPRPDATIVLTAPAAVIHSRKAELPIEELDRQLVRWRDVAARLPGAEVVDASLPMHSVLEAAERACGLDSRPPRAAAQVALVAVPPMGTARWLIPPSPRRHARAGIRIYHPMTMRGRVCWEAARLFAGVGLARAVPGRRTFEPPEAVRKMTPPGGGVAVFRGDVPARMTALIFDADGREVAVAKVADDEAGRQKLAREADRLRYLAPLLEPPLSSPRILAEEPGFLATQAVPWRPRARPWLLPTDLARAIGRFHGIEAAGESVHHPGHGDFAPWNVMRTNQGWALIDWEEATPTSQPFRDPFHYLVQAHALLGRPTQRELLQGLHGDGWVGRSLRTYALAAGLDGGDHRQALIDYLVETAAAVDPTHPAADRSRAARRRLLDAFGWEA
jgi:hypothetical protein